MANFVLDLHPEAVLNRLVPPHLQHLAERVRDEAIATVPRGTDHPDPLGREYHPPLWTTIEVRPSQGKGFLVGSDQEHARYLHEGTDLHYIEPRRGGRLVFHWKKRGYIFIGNVGQATRHPGTRPVPFLTDAARRVLGR